MIKTVIRAVVVKNLVFVVILGKPPYLKCKAYLKRKVYILQEKVYKKRRKVDGVFI